MSSSFPQFSVDEIILRHGSQNLYYFMIIHSHSITLDTATPLPGAHSVDSISYWFYLCLKCIKRFPESFSGKFRNNCSVYQNFPEHYSINWNFPEHYSVKFRNSRTTSRKFPFYGKKSFRNSGTFSIMEMEKISGSFSYVNRNPEFWWKP